MPPAVGEPDAVKLRMVTPRTFGVPMSAGTVVANLGSTNFFQSSPPQARLMSMGERTLVAVMSSKVMFSTIPPRPGIDLMRAAPPVSTNVQRRTVTLRMPPAVSDPMEMPPPAPMVQSEMRMFSDGLLTRRPSASRPDLTQMSSSSQLMSQRVMFTSEDESMSMPSELAARRGARMVRPSISTF